MGGRLAYRFASSYDDDAENEDAAAAEDVKEDGDRRIRMTPTRLLANIARERLCGVKRERISFDKSVK